MSDPAAMAMALAEQAMAGRRAERAEAAGADQGVFSVVWRVHLAPPGEPATVVVKEPVPGPNGEAAAASGAYRREAFAYRHLLPRSPVATPACLLVDGADPDRPRLVLEDLGRWRPVDQVTGMGPGDAAAVAVALASLHRHWRADPDLDRLPVRRSAPAAFAPADLAAGRIALDQRWAGVLDRAQRAAAAALVDRREPVVERFDAAGPLTLCHGDPRADNLVFDAGGAPVLFDWQQVAVQAGEADLAWLLTTSTTPAVRREIEADLLAAYAAACGHEPAAVRDRYRAALVVPGLAVLVLAQRQIPPGRAARLVATSLQRITTALVDWDVAGPG